MNDDLFLRAWIFIDRSYFGFVKNFVIWYRNKKRSLLLRSPAVNERKYLLRFCIVSVVTDFIIEIPVFL